MKRKMLVICIYDMHLDIAWALDEQDEITEMMVMNFFYIAI
jgi:hypothetical protein